MVTLKRFSGVMENPQLYQLWQAPFRNAKFAPIRKHNDISRILRVLDVGCGPGTNAPIFGDKEYVGLDFNHQYIQLAQRRYRGTFITADAREYAAPPDAKYDFILLNSLLHHIATEHVKPILAQLSRQLTPDGHIHILDLVLPEQTSLSRYLALSDRGEYPRPWAEWERLFTTDFEAVVCEPYSVGWCGVSFWNMIYFKGRSRHC
jgi:SAM-dependent methyltransferase